MDLVKEPSRLCREDCVGSYQEITNKRYQWSDIEVSPQQGPSDRHCHPPLIDRLREVEHLTQSHSVHDTARPSALCITYHSLLLSPYGVPEEVELFAADPSPISVPPLCPASSHRSHEEGLPGGAEPGAEQDTESPTGPRWPPETAPVRWQLGPAVWGQGPPLSQEPSCPPC